MAYAAWLPSPNKDPSDILTRLDKHFRNFWRQLKHKMHPPAPSLTNTNPHRSRLPESATPQA
ncbi:Hypothetical predicted protein, partial [Pelobates cultripes]